MTTVVHHLTLEDVLFAAARHYRPASDGPSPSSATDANAAHAAPAAGADFVSIADVALAKRLRRSFDQGRATAHARSRARLAARTSAIRQALDLDLMDEKPAHGRPGRIARKTGINRRTVDRILAALMSVA